MATSTTRTNKPILPRGNDQSPLKYNRAALYSGKALDFDGVNDYVDCGTLDITGYTQMSMSFYFKADTTSYDWRLISLQYLGVDDIRIFHTTSGTAGKLSFALDDGSPVTISEDFNVNEWYHVVMTHDGTTLKAYFNGVLVQSAASDFNYSGVNGLLYIGRYTGGTFSYYDGEFANYKLFNTALTAAQVSDLYNNPEKIVPTGVEDTALKLWLPMMEGAGTTAYDGSGNGNHGTISGATYVHGVGAPVAQSAVMDWNKGTNNIGDHAWDASAVSNNSSISTSSHPAPNEVETAFIFDDGTANTYHRSYKQASCSAGEVTASVFVKKKDVDYINVVLGVDGGSTKDFALVDLVNGTINDTSGNPTATSIKSVGDGWYYVSVQETHASGNAIIYIYGQDPTNGSSIDDSYTGANNQTYIWGASVKEGAINNVFIPTYGSVQTSPVLLPQGLTSGRDITGVNLFENVRKQGALNLDGNSWAEVHDNASLDITDAITLEAWVYWDANTNRGILGRWITGTNERCYLLYKANSTNISMYVSSDGTNTNQDYVSSSTTISNGWNHLVGTYDGTKLYAYVNGVLTNSKTTSVASITSTSDNIEIARYNADSTTAVTNQIAQPRIYNRALTAEEVQRNYDAGKNIYTNS